MNSIPLEQNSERQLLRLAAQRQLYASAKRIFGWQMFLGGPVAVGIAFVAIAIPSLQGYAALWGVLVVVIDIVFLTRRQKNLRLKAAQIQEAFDCEVLHLPWQGLKVGRRPDHELVVEQASYYLRVEKTMPPLTDWYPKEVGTLPLHIARLICQRANCWWDSKQRRRYAATVIVSVTAIFAITLFFGMSNDLTVEGFVLSVLAPLSPALLLGYRQFIEQIDAARRLDDLKAHAEDLWVAALSRVPEQELTAESRNLQDEIFENRKRSPLVFDFVFKRLRQGYEEQMNRGAAELIAEAVSKLI
jgi:hypothetical protein